MQLSSSDSYLLEFGDPLTNSNSLSIDNVSNIPTGGSPQHSQEDDNIDYVYNDKFKINK